MSEPIIHWKAKRTDEGEKPDLREAERVMEIERRIECDGGGEEEIINWNEIDR